MSNAGQGAAVAQAAAGAGQAYSQVQAGQYTNAIDRWNARVADLQALDAVNRGEDAVNQHQAKTRMLLSEQRASYAGQGVVVGTGSAADAASSAVVQSAADDQTIRANAALEAWGYKVQGVDQRARGRMAEASANNEAIGTLLTTSGRFADNYDRFSSGSSKKVARA